MAIRRVTFRLYPTKQVEQKLYYHRRLHKDLYNAAVYNRKTQYQKFGHEVDYFEQQNCLPDFKEVWIEYKEINSQALQATLKRVDFAFQRFLAGLSKYPRFKSIRHYSGWTYPATSGWNAHTTGNHGYLELSKIGQIRMRGHGRLWGRPTTCTILYRNGKWYASITVDVDDELLKQSRTTGTGAVGVDIGCLTALAITDGENHQLVDAPKFLRKAEKKIKHASKNKRRKRAPNKTKKVKASKRWNNAQRKVSKLQRKVANQRANWVHQVAKKIVSCNSMVATEELEVLKMTRKAKKTNKRKRQKAGLNKSILDVGFGMLRAAIKYKVVEAGGLFVEVPTKTIKPSQTCPECGVQHKKNLSDRVHNCACGCVLDRDIAAAKVCLLWSQDKLPGYGNDPVKRGANSSTPKTRKHTGSMKQLGALKRQKSQSTVGDAETPTSRVVGWSSSY